jgi:pimeloyl-ACP methyl ester carboxylesterase
MSLQLPACARTGTIALAAGHLAVVESVPDPRTRGTVVLVPGYTGSKEDFLGILERLTNHGHRVIAYDQRGQHESPGGDDPAAYAIDVLAGELLELVDTLGDGPAHVVGHSFGGLVSRAAALRRPAAFRSLTLLDSGPSAIPGARAERVRTLRPVLVEGGKDALWQRLVELNAGDEPSPPEVGEFVHRRFHGNSAAGLLVMGDALLAEPDRTDQLREVAVPMLVAYGADDDAWPPAVQAEMAQRLTARQAVIADAVHSPAVEQPEATAAVLLAFWAAVEDEPARPARAARP